MYNALSTEEYPIAKTFSSSFEGQILKIRFAIRVVVKHGMAGEGVAKEIPIKIMPS